MILASKEDQLEDLPKYKLMIKSHYETGLNYLCVTTKKNFVDYSGSGKLWRTLLRKYPNSEIFTNVLFMSDDRLEFNKVCIAFSKKINVVKDPSFANLVDEVGYSTETNNLVEWWNTATDIQKRRAREKQAESCRKHIQVPPPVPKDEILRKRQNTMMERYGVKHILQNDHFNDIVVEKRKATMMQLYGVDNVSKIPEVVEKRRVKISKSLRKRIPKACQFCGVELINVKLHENYHCHNNPNRQLKPMMNCEVCGKTDISIPNYKRWHGDKCTRRTEPRR